MSLHDLVEVWVGRARQARLVTSVSYSCAKKPEDVQFGNILFRLVVVRDLDVFAHFDLLLSALLVPWTATEVTTLFSTSLDIGTPVSSPDIYRCLVVLCLLRFFFCLLLLLRLRLLCLVFRVIP